jgi:hypothetical protein
VGFLIKNIMRTSIRIFDIVLNGIDAERFCALDIPSKIEYIQKVSSVKDEARIRKFLELPPKQFIVGCCGFSQPIKQEEDGGNITSGNEPESVEANATNDPKPHGEGSDGGRDVAPEPESPRIRKGGKTKR